MFYGGERPCVKKRGIHESSQFVSSMSPVKSMPRVGQSLYPNLSLWDLLGTEVFMDGFKAVECVCGDTGITVGK